MKINRTISEEQLNRSKQKAMDFVMEEIKPLQKRSFTLSLSKYKYVLTSLVVIIALATLSLLNNPNIPTPPSGEVLSLYESERLAEFSYISGNLISSSFSLSESHTMFLSNEDETEFETNIDEFNVYFDMLKAFLEDDNFEDSVLVTEGNDEYTSKITFTEDSQDFTFYVNLNDDELEGILIIDDVTLTVTGTFFSNEEEVELKLKAQNNNDYIEIEYKIESKDEIERKYEIKQSINNVVSEKEIKIEFGDNETKVEIKDNEDTYELKKELEEGVYIYKLEYEVNGVSGEVRILEVESNGVITYNYIIEEDGKEPKEIEKDDPDNDEEEETNYSNNNKLKESTI